MTDMSRIDTMRDAIGVADPSASTKPNAAPRRNSIRRAAIGLALLTGTALAGYYGHDYWTVGRFLVSTDDAYVKADSTTVAPKVAGYLAEVLVSDNQPVRAGQVLARIDDRDLRTALDAAHADVAAADATVANLDARISLQGAEIAQAQAAVDATEARLAFARADAERYRVARHAPAPARSQRTSRPCRAARRRRRPTAARSGGPARRRAAGRRCW